MALDLEANWAVKSVAGDRQAIYIEQSTTQFSQSGTPMIRVWCKGVTVDATVDVTRYVAEPNTSFQVGLVQILEHSKMVAKYGDVEVTFRQEKLPCYDSDVDANIPWYNLGRRADITAVAKHTFTLNDYPWLNLEPHLDRPGLLGHGNALSYGIKHNKFNIYLMLRTTRGGVVSDRYLKHCRWETLVELRPLSGPTWSANMYSPAGYEKLNDKIWTSWVYKVITAQFHSLPPVANGSANQHQLAPTYVRSVYH